MNIMSDQNHLIQLQAKIRQAKHFKYLCFWGHTPNNPLVVDKSCLSQWFPAVFHIDGVCYYNAEQYMMAKKAELFQDDEIFQKIIHCRNPQAAKALGRQVRRYDEALWQQHRFEIVLQANTAKFSQNPALAQFLLQTKHRILVEASPVDRIWGIGLAADDAKSHNPLQWRGLNLLGFALMQVREQLLNSTSASNLREHYLSNDDQPK